MTRSWTTSLMTCTPGRRTVSAARRPHRLALPRGDYRVRYSVRGFDEADHTEETPDAYLLQFWPAAPTAADRILRRTSTAAAHSHRATFGPAGYAQFLADLRARLRAPVPW